MSRHRTAPLNPPVNSESLRGFDLFDGDVHVDVDCLQKPNSSLILSPRGNQINLFLLRCIHLNFYYKWRLYSIGVELIVVCSESSSQTAST